MNEREILLKKIGTYKFAITDINLFLNTHPADSEMLKKRDEYLRELEPLIKKYEDKYGPLTKDVAAANNWSWIKDPWPWDTEE